MRRGPRFPGGLRRDTRFTVPPNSPILLESLNLCVVPALLSLGMNVYPFPPSDLHIILHDEQEANIATLTAPPWIPRALIAPTSLHPPQSLSPPRKIHTKSVVPHEPLPVSGTRRDAELTFGVPSLFSSIRIISPSPIPTLHK